MPIAFSHRAGYAYVVLPLMVGGTEKVQAAGKLIPRGEIVRRARGEIASVVRPDGARVL